MNQNFNKIQNDEFDFHLSQTNKIKPKSLKNIDIIHLIRQNNLPELNNILNDLSQENFEENDYFDLNRDELKLIKSYQILTQYMIFSINNLTRKNKLLNELSNQQLNYNEEAEKMLMKQQKKIKEQEETLSQLTNNCINMEFLIKKLHLEEKVNELGVDMNANPVLNSQELENLRNQMNENKDLNNKFEQSEINNQMMQSNVNNQDQINNVMIQSSNFQNSQENFNNQSQQQ
jgi:hypothetical protein